MDRKRALVAPTRKGMHSVLTTSACKPEAQKLRQELGRSFLPFLQAAARLPEELSLGFKPSRSVNNFNALHESACTHSALSVSSFAYRHGACLCLRFVLLLFSNFAFLIARFVLP